MTEQNGQLPDIENQTVDIFPETKEISKKEIITISLKLIGFIICSLVYLICKAFDRFGSILDSEIISHQSITYSQSIMYFSHFMSIIVIILGLLFLINIFFPINLKIPKNKLKKINEIVDWLLILPICVTISTFCFTFLFTLTVVNGSSMKPTVDNNDQLVLLYYHKIDRFDVVVIDVSPEHYHWYSHKLFLKRVIGLPGDEVDYRLEDGRTKLYINNQLIEESFYPDDVDLNFQNAFTFGTNFIWSDVCYYLDEQGEKINCQTKGDILVIPEGYYFVLGDNRGVSQDSRAIGLIKAEDILGTAVYKMHSLFKCERIK